jgi:ring-1,2-phenylacetyl-CoA epoxidase subunit PaaE
MAALRFHELNIAAVRPQTDAGIALTFNVPKSLQDDFTFTPGQYLTLRASIDGEDVRRSYSICSSSSDPDLLEVGIKQVDGGLFSNYAMTLAAGDRVAVMPPQGRFTATIGGRHRYLLIAAGSGITPCLSIAKSVLANEPDSQINLLYGNRSTASVMFRSDLDDLKDQYLERFSLIHTLSAERQDVELLNGRLTREKIAQLIDADLLHPDQCDRIYLCGPQQMIEDCKNALLDAGTPEDKIAIELFTTDESRKPSTRKAPAAASHAQSGATVTIIHDGAARDITVDGTKDTVLAAAQRAGMDLPFSCAGGMCCTCRCKIVSGEASMDLNYSLEKWEIDAGFTLACQSRPESEQLVLDFDAS